MTNTNNSTYPKYDITKRVQGYLETAMPRSVLLAAYRTGRQEAIITHVKEHYNADAGDCIGIETVVRDAIQNIVLDQSFQEESKIDTLTKVLDRVFRFPHNVDKLELLERVYGPTDSTNAGYKDSKLELITRKGLPWWYCELATNAGIWAMTCLIAVRIAANRF